MGSEIKECSFTLDSNKKDLIARRLPSERGDFVIGYIVAGSASLRAYRFCAVSCTMWSVKVPLLFAQEGVFCFRMP